MYYNKVEICGINTSRLKTLSDSEKKELLERIKKGDNQARQQLIDGNLRLVLSIIQRFTNRRENSDDLFQVGCIGLIKAVDNFNTELDVKFSTYAVPMNILYGKKVNKNPNKKTEIACMQSLSFCSFGLIYPVLQKTPKLAFPDSQELTLGQFPYHLTQVRNEHEVHRIFQ